MPAAIATSLFNDDGDDDDDDDENDDDDDDDVLTEEEPDANANVVAIVVAVVVLVAVTVAVTVFVTLGDVEPDVRLNITNPASMKNGALLPLVGTQHVSLAVMPRSQQNMTPV